MTTLEPAPTPPSEKPTWVRSFDDRVDRWFDTARRPALDPLFYGLSSAADHSLLWFALGAARAARRRDPRIAVRFGAIMGIESALTNGPIKAMFRRVRPPRDHAAPMPYGVRIPITSSFPSGHATAAFTAAVVLSQRPRQAAFWFPLAALVASSRVYVRLHYASDVAAGAALGVLFGTVARRLLPIDGAAPQ